jgi:hypothetical protein
MMVIEEIVDFCHKGAVRWTQHMMQRLIQRNIRTDDIVEALVNGKIIEQYPTDYPFPSCLVLGTSKAGKLHIVCGSNGTELWLITAYFPNPDEWSDDLQHRKEPKP